jgi:Phage gp6-like head-tail connector protein
MSVIAIETAMQHVYAETEDQTLVQLYLDAAEDQAAQFMQRRFYADTDALAAAVLDGTAGDDPIVINASIKAACLLIVGHLFANREDVATGVSAAEIPMGSRSLLMPYRVKMGV